MIRRTTRSSSRGSKSSKGSKGSKSTGVPSCSTHSESSLAQIIRNYYEAKSNAPKYIVENVYVFNPDWESDILIVGYKPRYAIEIEIKCTRADFKADLKKVKKHLILSTGYFEGYTWVRSFDPAETKKVKQLSLKAHFFRPNKFYYAVPEELKISELEVPSYAGLMVVRSSESGEKHLEIVKPAPLIHKAELELEKPLCSKIYVRWRRCMKQ